MYFINRLLLVLIFFPVYLFSQISFQKTYGGNQNDFGYSVQPTADGGYIISGATESFGAGSADAYLIKTDSLGNIRWEKTFGGDSWDYGSFVHETHDKGYIIVGATSSFGAGGWDIYLIKTDSSGNLQWNRTLGGNQNDFGNALLEVDGGYIIIGETNSFDSSDVFLVKIDSLGNLLWQRTFGGSSLDYAKAIKQTRDNGYIITGWTNSFGAGMEDVYLVKTDSIGNLLWQRTFGDSNPDYSFSVSETPDGGFIIVGNTFSYGGPLSEGYLVKTDSLGNMQWFNTFGGSSGDAGYSIQITSDNGYIISGTTYSFGVVGSDIYLLKTDSVGNSQWQKTFGGGYLDEGRFVQLTNDGGFIITGWIDPGPGSRDVCLIKTDANGNVGIVEKNPKIELKHCSIKPNPFSHFTEITYSVPKASYISCEIFDVTGKSVRKLKSGWTGPGVYNLKWDGKDDKKAKLSPGIYFINLITNESKIKRKITLLE